MRPKKGDRLVLTITDGAHTSSFGVSRDTRLGRVLDVFLAVHGLCNSGQRLRFEGQLVWHNDTPADLGLQNEDVIDCVVRVWPCCALSQQQAGNEAVLADCAGHLRGQGCLTPQAAGCKPRARAPTWAFKGVS